MSTEESQKVERNPLFVNQLGDVRCSVVYPWYRSGRCYRYHSFDTAVDSDDSAEPVEASD